MIVRAAENWRPLRNSLAFVVDNTLIEQAQMGKQVARRLRGECK